MGGYGSGKRWQKKSTVEDCLNLDATPRFGSIIAPNGDVLNKFIRISASCLLLLQSDEGKQRPDPFLIGCWE